MNTNLNEIKDMLERNNIKGTHQRLRIMEYLIEKDNHPTVDTIYEDMVDEIPTLSKTTVYNTVKKFSEKGIIEELTITGSEKRYDVSDVEHSHFFCKKCNSIYNIKTDGTIESEEFLTQEGHQVEEIHRYFKGICQDCRED